MLGIALGLVLLSVGLCGCFRVNSDARALRDSVMKAATGDWEEKIEIGVGAITLNLAQAGLAFVDLGPEVRTALRALRGVEAGVYQHRHQQGTFDRAAVLSAADKVMTARGWDRVVAVVNESELVAAYLPGEARSTRNVRICLVVLNATEMVVASARTNLEPLVELAMSRAEWRPPR
jgi:hypothetical protein